MTAALLRTFLPVMIIILFLNGPLSAGIVNYMHITSIYGDDKEKGLKQPEGVACNEGPVAFVADTANSRILKFVLGDDAMQVEAEITLPQMQAPVTVSLNSKGEVFVLDGREQRIIRLGPDGALLGTLSPSGVPSPSSYIIKSFTIDSRDNIYLLDIYGERVIVLNPDAEFTKEIKFPDGYGFISDLSVDFKFTLLVLDSIKGTVYSADRNSAAFSPLTENMDSHMRFATNITTDNRGRIYLVDRNGGRIIAVGQNGSYLGQVSGFGWKEGRLNYPSQICINGSGDVFVADTNNNRVQVFKLLK